MATADEYAEWIVKNQDKKGTPAFETVAQAYRAAAMKPTPKESMETPAFEKEAGQIAGTTKAEAVAGSPATRFLTGMGSPFFAAGQIADEGRKLLGVSDLWRPELAIAKERYDQMADRGRSAAGSEGFDWAGLAGTMTSPLSVGMLATKAAPTLAGKAMQGIGMGATMGILSPTKQDESFWDSKAAQGGFGATLGGLIPPLVHGGTRLAQGAVDLFRGAPAKLATRAAGDKSGDVADAILSTRSDVPGVNLSAGQRAVPAASPEFSALQAKAAQADPALYSSVPTQFGQPGIMAEQQAAREAALRQIAGTPQLLTQATAARRAASDVNYEAAFGEVIKRDKELRELWKNPYFKDEVGEAWKLAQAKGISPKANLTEFLHYVKEGLDAKLASLTKPDAPAISATAKKEIANVKTGLVNWIEKRNDPYKFAREEHIRLSQPMNQMRIGQELESALRNPLNELERPVQFANAINKAEAQISKATGRPRIEALTNSQRGVLSNLQDDFQRDASLQRLSQEGKQSLAERTGAFQVPPTGVFAPLLSAGRSWANRLSGMGHEKTMQELAVMMARDPEGLARAMKAMSPQQQKTVQNLMNQLARGGVLSSTAYQGVLSQ